jgi:hypothetical protein
MGWLRALSLKLRFDLEGCLTGELSAVSIYLFKSAGVISSLVLDTLEALN